MVKRCFIQPASGLNYSINQKKYLRAFLNDAEIPIDNPASERCIRTFCVGKKNWMFIVSVKGAEASAVIYNISETVKLNSLGTYNYFNHLLTELPKLIDKDRNVTNTKALEALLLWAKKLPYICRKPCR